MDIWYNIQTQEWRSLQRECRHQKVSASTQLGKHLIIIFKLIMSTGPCLTNMRKLSLANACTYSHFHSFNFLCFPSFSNSIFNRMISLLISTAAFPKMNALSFRQPPRNASRFQLHLHPHSHQNVCAFVYSTFDYFYSTECHDQQGSSPWSSYSYWIS